MRWGSMRIIANLGVVTGSHVIERCPSPDERRHVGVLFAHILIKIVKHVANEAVAVAYPDSFELLLDGRCVHCASVDVIIIPA